MDANNLYGGHTLSYAVNSCIVPYIIIQYIATFKTTSVSIFPFIVDKKGSVIIRSNVTDLIRGSVLNA